MSNNGPDFELPKKIEHYLAALSKLYANDGSKKLQEILVNAQIRVHEDWGSSSSNWNNDTFAHAVYLVIPESLYLGTVKGKDKIQSQIKDDINTLHNIQNEYVAAVFLEMKVVEDQDWRKESGLLLSGERIVLPDAVKRIWGDAGYKVFLSHKSEVKKEVATLKEELKLYGISSFVAHEDIHPTKEWQIEIENALDSMDAFVALLTDDFHNSLWTDQELGFAFGRGVPIVPVKLGKDPYGFIGKFQALACSWVTAAPEIVKILAKQELMVNALIAAVKNCENFDNGNTLAEILPAIEKLSPQQARDFIDAFNTNSQVSSSFGFTGSKPHSCGKGLAHHLSRLTGKNYGFSQPGVINILS